MTPTPTQIATEAEEAIKPPLKWPPKWIAREARFAISRDMEAYVSGSALPDKYQAALEYFTHGPEVEALILSAAARMVRESGAVEALESCRWAKVAGAHPEYCMKYKEDMVKQSLKKLRSITGEERQGDS